MESWIADGLEVERAMKIISAYAHLTYKIVATIVLLEKAIVLGTEIVSKIANCGPSRTHDDKLRIQFS